uniref:Uncharacterized protein n=1 Tax=Cucumis melo TaxID=3656 RepID=A0A9I9E9D3_CUCME
MEITVVVNVRGRMVGDQNNNGGSKQIGGSEHNGGIDHNSGDKLNGGNDGYSEKERTSEKKKSSKKKWTDSFGEEKGLRVGEGRKSQCPLQVGTVECGYYIMRYMREIVSNNTSIITVAIATRNSCSKLELDEVRMEWAEFLAWYI